MKKLDPIFVMHLFPMLDEELIKLLNDLTDEDWNRPTICSLWNVKDIVSHLLDGNIRKLSINRDNYFGEKPENLNSYADLVKYLNDLNANWVNATKRISPRILIELIEQTGKEVNELFRSVEPYEQSIFAVAWAGEEKSANWFDIAREYTEKWHHQQQIRLAVNKPGIMSRELYYPVLDTFMRALPYTYKDVKADEHTLLKFNIIGEAGGSWFLYVEAGKWSLIEASNIEVVSEVNIKQEIAWRLFTKGIDKNIAKHDIEISGNKYLGAYIINMLSVMA